MRRTETGGHRAWRAVLVCLLWLALSTGAVPAVGRTLAAPAPSGPSLAQSHGPEIGAILPEHCLAVQPKPKSDLPGGNGHGAPGILPFRPGLHESRAGRPDIAGRVRIGQADARCSNRPRAPPLVV